MIRIKNLLLLCFALTAIGYSQVAKIEYIAHAAFILESEQGTRILIDPYHSYNQMGYTFPDGIEVDAVLITHPHYDHDASKYVSENTPVFREAGNYKVQDISFYGIASNHAFYERIAASGNQAYNTIWVVTIGEKQFAHLGDNAIPTPDEVAQLKDVDFIIGHPNDEVLRLFPGKTYIPNHYLLPQVTKHTNWMQPLDGWLEDKTQVHKLERNSFTLNQENKAEILVFKPSIDVKEWSPQYYEALGLMKEASTNFRENKDLNTAIVLMDKAIVLSPSIFEGYLSKARLLSSEKKYVQIIATLEKGLASATDIDWGREARAHQLLANAYLALEQNDKAYNHYLWIVRHHRIVNTKILETAKAFVQGYK